MAKYISEECRQCEEWIRPYGCVNSGCPIRIDYDEGRREMAAALECDRLREERWENEKRC